MLIRCSCHELVDARRGDSYYSAVCLVLAATADCGKTQRLWAETKILTLGTCVSWALNYLKCLI